MKYFLWIIFVPVIAFGQTPVDYQEWDMGGGQTKTQLGGPPRNYLADDTWEAIENDWVTVGDSLYTANNAVLQTTVNDSGEVMISVVVGEDTVTIRQRLLSLKWFRQTDSVWLNIDNTPQWSTPSVVDDVISWNGVFPGVDIKIGKADGRVDYGLFFKPAFLDSAVVLYDQQADSASIYLANVIVCELTGVVDADSSLGTITKRKLRQWGKRVLGMGGNVLNYPQGRDDPHIQIYQRHRIVDGKLYVLELVKMSDLKWAHEQNPTATLWHRSSTTLESPGLWDSPIWSDNPGNHGTAVDGVFYFDYNGAMIIGYEGLDAIVSGATRDSAKIMFQTVEYHDGSGDIKLYGVWKWKCTEADVSYSVWHVTSDYSWGTVGCQSTNDAGAFNELDGSGDDRTATAEATVGITGLGPDSLHDLGWFPASGDSIIWVMRAENSMDTKVATTEHGTYPLTVDIFYTAAAPAGGGQVIMIQ